MAEKSYLVGSAFAEKLKQTVAAVEGRPIGKGGHTMLVDTSGDRPPMPSRVKIAAYPAGQPWRRGEVASVTMYERKDGAFTTTGETATAVNVSVDYMPLSIDSEGTASGPTPTMVWCVVARSSGGYVALEAEPEPLIRIGATPPSASDWFLGESRPVEIQGVDGFVDVTNPFNHYTKLDIEHGVLAMRSAGESATAYVLVGPTPAPMHAAIAQPGQDWSRGESREVSVLPDGVRTTEGQVVTVSNPFFDSVSVENGVPLPIGKFGTAYHVIATPASGIKAGEYKPPDKSSPWDRGSERPVRAFGTQDEVTVVNAFDHYTNLDLQSGLCYARSSVNPTGGQGTAYIVVGPPSVPLHIATAKEASEWKRDEVRELVAEADAIRPNPGVIDVTNRFFDSVEFQPEQKIAVGKFGAEYCLLTGSESKLKKAMPDGQTRIRKGVSGQVVYDESLVNVVSPFDSYEAVDLADGVVFSKVKDGDTGESQDVIISPPPIPLHIVDYTAGPTWVKGAPQPTLLSARPRYAGDSETLLTTADGQGVRNEVIGDIEPGDTPLVVGKFGDQLHVIAAETQPGVKLATRTDNQTWEKGSLRDVTLFGTEQTVQAYNAAGDYESFDGRSTGGLPDLALAKGKAPGGQGTAYYVISPAPATFATGTFTGQWSKGETRQVGVNVSGRSATLSVVNNFGTVGSSASSSITQNCAMSKQGTQWYLVAAECS